MHTDAKLGVVNDAVGDPGPENRSDEALVELALAGDAQCLSLLLGRHQRYLFNVALRFLQSRADAEDATQEILLRIATRLSSFRSQASFRAWAYRIAMNHLLDRARSRAERGVESFRCYAAYLGRAETATEPSPEQSLLVQEAKLTCTLGMLLCFDRRQRLVFILGEIFELSDREASELLDLTPDHFRQLLGRARAQLSAFMQARCGLVDPRNPCRCHTKTRAFVRDGIVDPENLTFLPKVVAGARDLAAHVAPHLGAVAARPLLGPDVLHAANHDGTGAGEPPSAGELLRAQPWFESPDLAAKVVSLLAWPRTQDPRAEPS